MIRKQLENHVSKRLQGYVGQKIDSTYPIFDEINKRNLLCKMRNATVIKSKAICQISEIEQVLNKTHVLYSLQVTDLIKQDDNFYVEEYEENRKAIIEYDKVITDVLLSQTAEDESEVIGEIHTEDRNERIVYDRREAVRYAEQWWNSYNPAYEKFNDDCTNFISQCLHAGGIPMTGYPNRTKGWWMRNNLWSYSWSVANAFRLYLQNNKSRFVERNSPQELLLGDIICYDFEGDGKFNHNTIIVAKDANGMPLVNAHSTNSRMRYWSYEDSTAYTPNIQYKFFHIIDG